MTAVKVLEALDAEGKIQLVTSKESWREQERTPDPAVRAVFAARREEVPLVPNDHRLLGFNSVDDGWRGFISYPLISDIVDDALFAALQANRLKAGDARHLMYAV